MINTSQTYKDLFLAGAIQDYKIIIDEVEYSSEYIYDKSISLISPLFDKPTLTVGAFPSSTFKVKLKVPSSSITKGAPIEFYYKYFDEIEDSEWILKFTGKVTSRSKQTDEITVIEAMDAAANYDVFLDIFPTEIEAYPANTIEVIELCADHLGVEIDNVEAIYDSDIVEFPNELTIIEVAKNIAKLSGGNFIITEENKLKLILVNESALVGSYELQKLEINSLLSPISKVTMYYSDEKAFEQGDGSGSEIVIDCPWATQGAVDHVFDLLENYEYIPMKSSGVYLDPAVQIGDSIEVNGVTQLIANINWSFDGSCITTIETPQNNDINLDDPYGKLVQQEFKRKITLGDSYQGISISRQDGIQMLYSPDGTLENSTGRFYANLEQGLAMQYRDDAEEDWQNWLYFDKEENVFKLALYASSDDLDNITDQVLEIEANLEGVMVEVSKIDSIETQVSQLNFDLDGLEVSVETSGGSNLIKNSVGFYDSDWSDYHTSVTNTEIKQETISGNAWELDNLLAEQEVSIPNGNYTLSFRYKKLLVPATVKIIVTTNEPNEIELTETSWTNGSFPINVTNNSFKVGIYADNAGSAWLSDLVVAVGELSPVWTPAIGESINGGVKIGGGKVELTSGQSNLMQVIDNTGNRIIDTQTNEVVTEYTVDGVNTKGIKATRGEIADVLIMSLSNQTTFTRL